MESSHIIRRIFRRHAHMFKQAQYSPTPRTNSPLWSICGTEADQHPLFQTGDLSQDSYLLYSPKNVKLSGL